MNNERIIYKAKKTKFIFCIPIMLSIIFYVISQFLLLLTILISFIYLLIYLTTNLIITNNKIIGQTGILNTYKVNILLKDVTNLVIERSFFGRILGYGDITLHVYNDEIIFRDIGKPEQFIQEYYNLISKINI